MRLRRRTVLLLFALLLLVGGALSLPAVHWRLIGWCRGEAFYRDRPTSWWAREIHQSYAYFYVEQPQVGTNATIRPDVVPDVLPDVVCWYQRPSPTLTDKLWQLTNGPPALNSLVEALTVDPPLLDGDPGGLPVLCELLRHPDSDVRLVAASGLASLGRWAAPAVAVLRVAAEDETEVVRRQAVRALQNMEAAAIEK